MPSTPLQNFDDPAARTQMPERLAALRAELSRHELDGVLVPRADQHQNEYVPASEERLAYISGFSGSAGLALIEQDRASLFVDGRYVMQAPNEVDSAAWQIVLITQTSPESWIVAHLRAGARIGYDPWLHPAATIARLDKACARAGAQLVAMDENPIDAIWRDRPDPPCAPITIHPLTFAGEAAADKLARLREAIATRADALVISDPHALAWTFNIRGGDVAHTPLPLGYAIVTAQGRADIFLDPRKLNGETRAYLSTLGALYPPAEFAARLKALAAGARILLDETTAAMALHRSVRDAGGEVQSEAEPIARLKAIKNAAEIAGARAAHLRDGAALTRLLAWLAREAPSGQISEIDAVMQLEAMRRSGGLLKDISFPTICGAGPHGAIVHYRVTRTSNRKIGPGELLLIDSGAQYEDGTTDVTRTLAIGTPSDEMRDRFTRVLKGHIAIARAVFPRGTSGAQLDSFARQFLWQAGVDFDHGTGHGVGSYLSVHEGPARISKLGRTALEPGMILSNEPGYYKPGAFGIRIENLILVREIEVFGAEHPMLGFETLTLAPIDRTLIAPALMSADEMAWLDAYHAHVQASLTPHLDRADADWLAAACAPLGAAAP